MVIVQTFREGTLLLPARLILAQRHAASRRYFGKRTASRQCRLQPWAGALTSSPTQHQATFGTHSTSSTNTSCRFQALTPRTSPAFLHVLAVVSARIPEINCSRTFTTVEAYQDTSSNGKMTASST